MKKLLFSSLAGLILFTSPTLAYKLTPGWYAGITGGVGFAPPLDATFLKSPVILFPDPTVFPPFPNSGEIDYRVMASIGGQLGYRFFDCYRLEIEGIFNYNQYDSITIGGVEIERKLPPGGNRAILHLNGRTSIIAGMLNGYYDFIRSEEASFAPYIGLGIGYATLENTLKLYSNDVVTQPYIESRSSSAAGQIILGGSYTLDSYTTINLDYRYFTTQPLNESNALFKIDERYQSHSINLSFNFAFDCTF